MELPGNETRVTNGGSAETDGDPAAEPTPEEQRLTESASGPVAPPRVLVPRWIQLVLLPLAILALWALARAAGKVFVIFVVASLIALILNPAVSLLQRTRLSRGLAVLAVYLAFFLTLAGIGALLANPISNQVQSFARNLPHLTREANKTIAEAQNYFDKRGIHLELVKQGKTALQTIQDKLSKSSSKIVSFGGGLLTETVSAGFDLIVTFVVSVYMLLYGQRIGHLIRRWMPEGDGTKADDYPTLVQHALSRYLGGQLLFSLIMGTTTGVALYLFGLFGIFPAGRTYAIAFGAFLGIMELVPYVGPIVGAIPPILVALLTDPITAIWVALLFVGLQQLEGHVVAPQIFGHTLRINPVLVILALLLGEQIYGLAGALLALPILSVLRETVLYLGRHLELERWDSSTDGLL